MSIPPAASRKLPVEKRQKIHKMGDQAKRAEEGSALLTIGIFACLAGAVLAAGMLVPKSMANKERLRQRDKAVFSGCWTRIRIL